MTASWLLYYAMLAAHVLGGGYALLWGRNVHRSVAAVLLSGAFVEFGLYSLLNGLHISFVDYTLDVDILLNTMMCCGLFAVAVQRVADNWMIPIMVLQAASLGFDGFVFNSAQGGYADAQNALNIVAFIIVAGAAAAAHSKCREGDRQPGCPEPFAERRWV